MTGTIFVCGLFDMPHHVRTLAPSHLVSIIQPELQPESPPEIPDDQHLRVQVHDISEPDGYGVLPEAEHVVDLLHFLHSWDPEGGDLLVHCYAGVSRSTATALLAHLVQTEGTPLESARALRAAAPHAAPNRRIITLADRELGLGGELVRAVDAIGGRLTYDEDVLTVLPLQPSEP